MADFLLSVGVDIGLSYAQMQKDISSLVSQLNSKPASIKVKFDEASLNTMRTQLLDITKGLKNTGVSTNVNTAGVKGIAGDMASVAANAERAANATRAAKAEFQSTQGAVKTLSLGSKEYYNALRQVQNLLTQVTSSQEKWTAAKTGKSSASYNDLSIYASELTQLISQLQTGAMSVDQFNTRLAEIRANVTTASSQIRAAGEATQSWTQRVGALSAKFGTWFNITRVIMAAYRAVREMVSASIELQDAFTQLKIVTGATDAEMERFTATSVNLAKSLGKSVTEVTNSIEVFSRLGYSLEDAAKLAEYATILSNVAAVDTNDATTGLTSIVKGFDLDVSETSHVADVLVSVGQEYAVSASELMEAYARCGAALNATNTSFEKSAGLIAAANASVQDASIVGTALKTVSARIRGSKTDLEELGETTEDLAEGFSKYAKEIKALTGFDIMVEGTTDQFKDIYDIFEGISQVWDKLSDTQQARVSEILGGTRQLQVISSIIGNWDDAAGAYARAMDSVGVATNANNIYMETATAHIQQFKATFQDFGSNLITSGLITTIVDIGTGILSVLNTLQKVHLLLPTLITLLATIKGISMSRQLSATTQALIGNKVATEGLILSVSKMTMAQKKRLVADIQAAVAAKTLTADEAAQILTTLGLATAEGTLTIANKGLAASFKSVMASIPVWGWIALGISVVIEAISLFTSNVTSSVDEVKNLEDELNNIANTATETANKFRDLKASAEDIIPRFVELAQGVNQYGENMGDLSEDEYAEFLKLNNQLAEMFPELNLGMDDNGNAMLALSYSADTLSQSLWDLVDAQREAAYTTIAEGMADELDTIAELEKKYNKEIDKLEDIKDEWTDVYNDILNQSLPTNVGRYSTQEAGYQAALDFIEKAQRLGMHGDVLMDNQQTTNNGYVFSVEWDYTNIDIGAIKKLYDAEIANQDKLIHNYENKIAAAWNKLNPIVSAWMNTDFIFNDLDSTMQEIALTMASGLNFSELGLKTEDDVKKYITEHILDPLFLAGDDVKEAFANITDWKTQLANGEITAEEFSSKVQAAFNGLISSMDADEVDTFKTAFVTGMNAMGIEGNTFDEVVTNLINDWSNFDSKVSGSGSTFDSTKKLVNDFKTELEGVQKIIASQEPGKSLSIDDYNAEGMEDYRDALEYTNGAMQLNAEKVREITEAKAEEQKQTIATNKALAQDQYLKNAKQIEEYRKKLAEANYEGDETEESVRASIAALLDENSALADTCKQYDLLSTSITEATSAYSHWLNAQSASDYGDMADDAVSAIEKIRDTYDIGSEDYGNFGSKKFSAAIEFIVPDTVDQEDLAAVEAYMQNFQQYLTFDDDGGVTGLNVDQFLSKAVEAGLMSYSEDDGFQVLGGKKMEDFAKGLNMSSGMVTAFFDELQLKGADFDWGDEGVKTFGDLAVEANEAAEALRLVEANKDLKIKLDVSDLATTEEQVNALDTTIASMNAIRSRVNVSAEDVEYANSVIQYCITQKQLLTQPDVMRVDTSQCEGDVANVVKLLQDFQTAQNNLEIQQTLGMDTTEAQTEVDGFYESIQNLSPEVKTKLGLDTTSLESLQTSLAGVTAEVLVTYGVNADAVNGYNPESKTCDVIYNPKTDLLPQSFDDISVSVYYDPDTDDLPTYFKTITRYVNYVAIGDSKVQGTAHAGGTAAAGGDWGTAAGGHTLVGELGREIVVDPRTGRWYTVGDNGAEFVNIPAGAIVFNHIQTESLLNNGYVAGRAAALVSGTAMVTGGYKPYKPTGGYSGGTGGGYSGSGGSSGNNGSSSTSTNSSSDKEESWFEKQYKLHNHLVKMNQETDEEYLTWLANAYKKAYNEGVIELDDYRKYAEEVYTGLQELFEDYLDDVEHEISMRENFDNETTTIIAMYQGLMKDIEKEITAARAAGLDDSDEYIQNLQNRWWEYSDAITEIQEETVEAAKDAVDELVEYRIDMIKQELEDEKDALDKKLDYLKEFYDKQKELLQEQYDEERYLEEQSEKRKTVTDLKSELAMLENDDSAWAQKRKLELQAELSEAEDDLGDFEDEHALDLALDNLESAYEAQEKEIQAQKDALDEVLNNPEALYNKALSDIQKTAKDQLYYQMLEYNAQHGDGNPETVNEIWENAYGALTEYQKLFGELYKNIEMGNATGVKDDTDGWDDSKISGTNPDNKPKEEPKKEEPKNTAPSLSKGSTITVKKSATHFSSKSGGVRMASFVPGGSYTVYQTSGSEVLIGRNGVYTGWINKSDIVGYAKGTKNATAGLHSLDELGSEYLFTSTDGNKYRVLSSGDKVLNARATDFLYEFANGGGEILEKIIKSAFGTSLFDHIQPVVNHNEIDMGDVIVHGSATQQTVSEIRRAQRDNLTEMLKSLNKLNK